jgi:hypothetical protein
MTRKQKAVVCEVCGSAYFQAAEFRQYRGGLYSSSVGGALSAVTNLPQTIGVCICGEPMPDLSIRRTGEDARGFALSVKAAKAYRAKQEPEALLQELQESLASKKDLATAKEQLAKIERALKVIMKEASRSQDPA